MITREDCRALIAQHCTPARFMQEARALDPGAKVGEAYIACACPIAEWMYETLQPLIPDLQRIEVYPSMDPREAYLSVHVGWLRWVYTLDPLFNTIALGVDDGSDQGQDIYAHEICAILDAMTEVAP